MSKFPDFFFKSIKKEYLDSISLQFFFPYYNNYYFHLSI